MTATYTCGVRHCGNGQCVHKPLNRACPHCGHRLIENTKNGWVFCSNHPSACEHEEHSGLSVEPERVKPRYCSLTRRLKDERMTPKELARRIKRGEKWMIDKESLPTTPYNNELLWRERLELAKSKLQGCHRDDRKHWAACRKEAEQRLTEMKAPQSPQSGAYSALQTANERGKNMANPNNCETCKHKLNPDNGHCHMFHHEPAERCMQHTGLKVALIDVNSKETFRAALRILAKNSAH